jgi:hypothetical protein
MAFPRRLGRRWWMGYFPSHCVLAGSEHTREHTETAPRGTRRHGKNGFRHGEERVGTAKFHFAKVDVESSNLFSRSKKLQDF